MHTEGNHSTFYPANLKVMYQHERSPMLPIILVKATVESRLLVLRCIAVSTWMHSHSPTQHDEEVEDQEAVGGARGFQCDG